MDSLFIYMLQALYLHFVPSFFSTRKVFSLLLGSFVWPAQLKLCLVSLQVAKRFGFFFSVNPWRWRTKFVTTLLACNKLLYATLYCNLLLGNFVNYTKQVLTIKYIYIYISGLITNLARNTVRGVDVLSFLRLTRNLWKTSFVAGAVFIELGGKRRCYPFLPRQTNCAVQSRKRDEQIVVDIAVYVCSRF